MKKAMILILSLMMNFSLLAETSLTDSDEVSSLRLENGAEILTSVDGLSLYTFDVDPVGESACFGQCLVIWPPLLTDKDSLDAPLSIHIRADGTKQVMLDNRPLYFFIQDKVPEDILGDGVGGTWHLINL